MDNFLRYKKDKEFVKTYVANGHNGAKTAEALGITPAAVCMKLKRIKETDVFRDFIGSSSAREMLKDLYVNGANATKRVEVYDDRGVCKNENEPDWQIRHKFCNDLVKMMGYLKTDGPAGGNSLTIIVRQLERLDSSTIERIALSCPESLGEAGSVLDYSDGEVVDQDQGCAVSSTEA